MIRPDAPTTASLSCLTRPFLTESLKPFLTSSSASRRLPLHGTREHRGVRWCLLKGQVRVLLHKRMVHEPSLE